MVSKIARQREARLSWNNTRISDPEEHRVLQVQERGLVFDFVGKDTLLAARKTLAVFNPGITPGSSTMTGVCF
jgi:hypothetical protein